MVLDVKIEILFYGFDLFRSENNTINSHHESFSDSWKNPTVGSGTAANRRRTESINADDDILQRSGHGVQWFIAGEG